MKKIKKLIAAIAAAAMVFGSAQNLDANQCAGGTEQFCTELAGDGYQECCQAPCLTPAIALGAIALVAIIAVAVSNSDHGRNTHCHH